MAYTPVIIDKWLHVAQDGYPAVYKYIPGRYGMSPKIIVVHIQEGTNSGSWQHFHVVQASSTVLIGKNGEIWRLVEEKNGPWTNGDVQYPTAKGWEVINKWGADPNVYTLSIETEGYTGEYPKNKAQIDAVLWQIQDWQTRYDIQDIYVIRHADINSVTRARCPGQAYYNELMAFLTQNPPVVQPVYAPTSKILVNGVAWDGRGDVTLGDRHFYGLPQNMTVHARVDGVQPHVYATRTSAFTRSALYKGAAFTVIGWCHGELVGGDDRWWITKAFSRIDVNGTDEKPPVMKAATNPDAPEGTIVQNGRVYYPAMHAGLPYHDLVVMRKANLRSAASLKAKVVGTVQRGDKVRALYYCFGGEVHEERAWWILDPGEGKSPIHYGPRLWCMATNTHEDALVDTQ